MAPTSTMPNRSRRYAGIVANPPPYIVKMIRERATKSARLPAHPLASVGTAQ